MRPRSVSVAATSRIVRPSRWIRSISSLSSERATSSLFGVPVPPPPPPPTTTPSITSGPGNPSVSELPPARDSVPLPAELPPSVNPSVPVPRSAMGRRTDQGRASGLAATDLFFFFFFFFFFFPTQQQVWANAGGLCFRSPPRNPRVQTMWRVAGSR